MAAFMEDRKEHGLGFKVSISDANTGLNVGISKAFPDICIQPSASAENARTKRPWNS